MLTLSQSAFKSTSATTLSILIWSCVLVGMLIVAFVVVMRVKKQMRDDDEQAKHGAATGFTLSDLRQMHRSGDISDEEFERAKAKIVEAARKAADRETPKPPDPERKRPPDIFPDG